MTLMKFSMPVMSYYRLLQCHMILPLPAEGSCFLLMILNTIREAEGIYEDISDYPFPLVRTPEELVKS